MRRLIGAILVLLVLASCASPSPTPVPVTETVPTSQPVTAATVVPKTADLIFVEFFAVT